MFVLIATNPYKTIQHKTKGCDVMTLQELLSYPAESRKEKIISLSQAEKQSLFKNIQEDCDTREKSYLSNQALLKKSQEELEQEMAKLKEQGINSLEELQAEITRLENDTADKIVEYSKVINGEANEPNSPQTEGGV